MSLLNFDARRLYGNVLPKIKKNFPDSYDNVEWEENHQSDAIPTVPGSSTFGRRRD